MKYNYLKPNLCKVLISVCPWMSVQIWNVRWIFLLIDDCGYLFSYSPCSTHNPSSFGIGNEVGFRVDLNSRISDGSVSFWDYTHPPSQNRYCDLIALPSMFLIESLPLPITSIFTTSKLKYFDIKGTYFLLPIFFKQNNYLCKTKK